MNPTLRPIILGVTSLIITSLLGSIYLYNHDLLPWKSKVDLKVQGVNINPSLESSPSALDSAPPPLTEEDIKKNELAKKDFSKGLNPKVDKSLTQNFQLVIPKIGVNWNILDGTDNPDALLLKGFWHYPSTSYPDERSNTAVLGHRWVYKKGDPRSLYSLDKLVEGDLITVNYKQKKFNYKMKKSYVTDAKDLSMMEGTLIPTLTLITSHPIEEHKIISKARLVVVAELVNE